LTRAAFSESGTAFLLWPAQKGSTKAIIALSKGGATEQELLNEVKRSPKDYTLSPDDVITLTNAKVPNAVIVEMIVK